MYYVFWQVLCMLCTRQLENKWLRVQKGRTIQRYFIFFFFVVSSSVVALALKFYQRVAIFQWVLETGGTYTKPSCCILYIIRKDTTQKLLKRIIALRYPVTNAYNWVCRIIMFPFMRTTHRKKGQLFYVKVWEYKNNIDITVVLR